jgi:hypothetical protein
MEKNPDLESRIQNKHPKIIFPTAYYTFFGLKTLKFFDADPDPGSGAFLTMDPGVRDGKTRIRAKHHASATLRPDIRYKVTFHSQTASPSHRSELCTGVL